MAKKKPSTLIVFVQDETGSMDSQREAAISAFNEYFDTLKKDSKNFGEVTVHAWQFSDVGATEERTRVVHQGALATVPTLARDSYRPRGITPLFDAVGTAMAQAESEKVDRYLFVVQTDGLENASKDFTREQVAATISEKEKTDNWTILFLGAGIANWAREAALMGASMDSAIAIPNTARAYAMASVSLGNHTSAYLASTSTSAKYLAKSVEDDVSSSAKAS